jgi:hypothetical protein
MRNAKRGRGRRHGVYVGAVAALGFALSGCGGSGTSASTTSSDSASGSNTSTGAASSGTPGTTSTGSSPSTKSSDSVTINWTPPTENTNGSPLTNLAGYNIHYGTSSASLTKTISISNPGIATYVVSNLTPGKYYFAVAAVNSTGTESPLSAQVSATVTN